MQPNSCAVRKIKEDMSQPSGTPRRNSLPPEILQILWPTLQVGVLSGMSGLFVGGVGGVLRSNTPTLFALLSGAQWFTLGSTFYGSRAVVLRTWGEQSISPRDRISASGIAGSISGAAGGLLRGPRNVLPGTLIFGLVGAGGQKIYSIIDASRSARPVLDDPDREHTWLNSKWSPVKILSDDEYEKMLRERLLRVNAEIALLDENVERLRNNESKIGDGPQSGDITPKTR